MKITTLAIFTWITLTHAGGPGSLAAKLAHRKFSTVIESIFQFARSTPPSVSSKRGIRVSMERLLKKEDDTPEKVIARLKAHLGEDHPLYNHIERLLKTTDIEIHHMDAEDYLALSQLLHELNLYDQTYKLLPLCLRNCDIIPHDESFDQLMAQVIEVIGKKDAEKYKELIIELYTNSSLAYYEKTDQVVSRIVEEVLLEADLETGL